MPDSWDGWLSPIEDCQSHPTANVSMYLFSVLEYNTHHYTLWQVGLCKDYGAKPLQEVNEKCVRAGGMEGPGDVAQSCVESLDVELIFK